MKTAGFTLLELIIVIIVLGVLAVSAASRFAGKDGVVEYTVQARVVAALRNMQARAMQDTRAGYCFQINFAVSDFGPPDYTHTSATQADLAYALNGGASQAARTCSTVVGAFTPEYLRSSSGELTSEGVQLSVLDGATSLDHIGFDSFGRPVSNQNPANPQPVCQSACQVQISGAITTKVCIEPEGYIHACP
ncbi:type II secretion system protein [Bowmanella yangjiangensis]|uniref:Type II secretion system protein n=1 Tax=Bowmanella yangjiangensis TaxID=2811230 RepID=A0ABS3CQB4_9ALTE|nr:type II secretion system protein [Bowmanella yangjiangensis]MBN7819293.1 type II secretion system protein [Bowmanella yangjiangensis]